MQSSKKIHAWAQMQVPLLNCRLLQIIGVALRVKCCSIYNMGRENLTLLDANNKCAEQPAHLRSLISALVVHFLESVVSKLATFKVSIF